MKSGTTWLQATLDGHPEIVCRGEGHLWDIFGADLLRVVNRFNAEQKWLTETTFPNLPPFPRFVEEDVYALIRLAAERLLARAAGDAEPKLIGEKTPNTVKFLTPMVQTFPEARGLHIVRDGRDAAISGWHHYKRLKAKELAEKWGNDFDRWLDTAAAQWVREVETAEAFAAAHPGRALAVRYEDLKAEPQRCLGDICRFLGVRDDTEALQAAVAAGRFERLSGGRTPGEEDRASFFRKGASGEWRETLTAEQIRRFGRAAGSGLARFGYDPE
jgi:hypothetical protein